jgi:diguanylate cyclase (GGDEF)-like protein
MEQAILTDDMTDLKNRRFGEDRIEEALAQLRRYQWSFGVIFLDLDGFKQINDTLGHASGDRVLHTAARVLELNSRRMDHACRWGGDEFVLVCPHAAPDTLALLAERLRMLLEHSRVTIEDTTLSIRASFGVTEGRPGDRIGDLIARVDSAMYESKERGGNCVTIR